MKRTFRVSVGDPADNKRQTTYRYSKVAPLLITRSVEEDSSGERYVISHLASGFRICRCAKLATARVILKALLPLTDWSVGREKLERDTVLLQQVRTVLLPFSPDSVIITTRRKS